MFIPLLHAPPRISEQNSSLLLTKVAQKVPFVVPTNGKRNAIAGPGPLISTTSSGDGLTASDEDPGGPGLKDHFHWKRQTWTSWIN